MSHIEQLVARQLECWDLRRRLEEEYRRGEARRREVPANGPCLLISREQDSGGTRLAHRLGDRLGWRVYDREIVEEIARLAHVRQQLVESVDEQVRSRWSAWIRPASEAEHLASQEYLVHLRQVILTLGHHGQVVIVGRGARFILPWTGTVSVRVIAPLEVRAKRRAESSRLTLEEARREIEQVDAGRRAFIRSAFLCDPAEPHHYDLVLNTGHLSLDAAEGIVLAAVEHALGAHPSPVACAA